MFEDLQFFCFLAEFFSLRVTLLIQDEGIFCPLSLAGKCFLFSSVLDVRTLQLVFSNRVLFHQLSSTLGLKKNNDCRI